MAAKPRRRAKADPVFRFLGGKGGVGKTTCAAAIAVDAAASGLRTLVISTDPAPSLGDALGVRLTASPRRVALTPSASPKSRRREGGLEAAEIDAPRSLNRWLSGRMAALERIAVRGTWLDRDDVARLLRLSLPGIDEIAALLELSSVGRSGRYDLVVVDTAPTGHTLRMLAMPDTLLAVAQVFDHMQAKHRVVVDALRGGWSPDADDEMIEGMAQEARELAAMLRDPSRTVMSWVTLPERMAVAETADAAAALASQGIPLADVIVNRLTPPPPQPCRWCDARRRFEAASVAALQELPLPSMHLLDAQPSEPIGVRPLLKIAASLKKVPGTFPQKCQPPFRKGASHLSLEAEAVELFTGMPATRATQKGARHLSAKVPGTFFGTVPGTFPAKVPATLLMFGGKGGVGKTTCAAAAALAAARGQPERRVLLLSTDPAHSLADALGVPVGDTPRRIPGAPHNLTVRELDAAAGLERVRERYRTAVDALFDRFSRTGGFDAVQDRQVMHDLIDLAPPGIDELAAVIDVVDMLGEKGTRGEADLIVIDTAPSGHALRLLEMPRLVQDWVKALMAILLKYQSVTGIGALGAVLVKLSQGLGRLRALLADRERTQFVVVTRAAALPRAEAVRLLGTLRGLGIHTPWIVINAMGAGVCARCSRQSARERREVAKLQTAIRSRRTSLAIAPATMPPPHGAAALEAWAGAWRAISSKRR